MNITVDCTAIFKEFIDNCVFNITYILYFEDCAGMRINKATAINNWFFYCSSGKGQILYNGRKLLFDKGVLIYIPRGTVYEVWPDKDSTLCYYCVGFRFKNLQSNDENNAFFLSDRTVCKNGEQYRIKNTIKVENKLNLMLKTFEANRSLELKCYFYEMLLMFFEDTINYMDNVSIYKRIERIIDYIHKNYNKKISVPDLSKQCGVSNSYFIREFSKYTGVSPMQYIIDIRINNAKKLLLLQEHSIKEIAAIVGFNDEMYFSKQFKKNIGISPSEYISQNIF